MKDSFVEIPLKSPLSYHMSGKFEALSSNWIHEDFDLTDFELILMTDGILYLEYNHTPFTVREGEYLLLPPVDAPDNRRKGFRESDCSFYWIHFITASPHRIFTPAVRPPAQQTLPSSNADAICLPVFGSIPNPGKLISLMKQLQSNARANFNQLTLNYETSSILCELYSQLARDTYSTDGRTQKQIYSDIIDYIKLNSNTALRVSDIALHFGYNEKYLSHLFGRLSGMPLKQFIIKTKMDEANYLLTDTNLGIGEIAMRLGYSDAHNFSRTYKKFTGLSPSAYRESYDKRLLYHV